jgi:hypothetical protein
MVINSVLQKRNHDPDRSKKNMIVSRLSRHHRAVLTEFIKSMEVLVRCRGLGACRAGKVTWTGGDQQLIEASKLSCIPTDKYQSEFDGEGFRERLEAE